MSPTIRILLVREMLTSLTDCGKIFDMSNTQTVVPTDLSFRNEIKEALKEGICTVVFTKTDGTERSMRCTLKQDMIPQDPNKITNPSLNQAQPNPPKKRVKTDNNLSVWDVEKKAWRSFNLPSVIKWKREY